MAGIFISYRHRDAAGPAGRIYGRLASVFPEPTIRDHETAPVGADIDKWIQAQIADADVMLVIVGPYWRSLLDEKTEAGEADYVSTEIAAALRLDKTIIPVLVQAPVWSDPDQRSEEVSSGTEPAAPDAFASASLPSGRELPDDIASFVNRKAIELREQTFEDDLDRLVEIVEPQLRDLRTRAKRWARRLTPGLLIPMLIAVGAAGGTAVAFWPEPVETMGEAGLDVAVAGWHVDGNAETDERGNELGQAIEEAIGEALIDDPAAERGDQVWGPRKVGIVRGGSDTELVEAARRRGREIGADVIVFGTARQQQSGRFVLELGFAILGDDERRTTDPRSVEDVFEVESSIDLERLRDDAIDDDIPEVAGIVRLLRGLRQLDADQLDDAELTFDDLVSKDQVQQSQLRYASHLLLGMTFSRKAEVAEAEANIQLAVTNYDAAQRLRPDSIDAQLGLLGAQYLAALVPAQVGEPVRYEALLDVGDRYRVLAERAEAESRDALRSLSNTMLGQIATVVAYRHPAPTDGLVDGERRRPELIEVARQHFQVAVDLQEQRPQGSDLDEELELFASGAFAGLALLEQVGGRPDSAISAYLSAQRLSSPYWADRYGLLVGDLYLETGDPCEAAAAYSESLPGLAGNLPPAEYENHAQKLRTAEERCTE